MDQAILLVRAHRLASLTLPGALAQVTPVPAPDISEVVDRWFATNTFHSEEFADLEQLVRWKRERGHTISLALPALNEAEMVGHVISTLKQALMDEVPLLDEIVLIDSNSTDATREIAASLGIPVYIHQHILADEVGSFPGKGEGLWKSLYVMRGDIIAWVDTDIVNIHPRFVYGILGPLLRWDTIQYVKGFYRRPIRIDGVLRAGGGGRVTELVARPLLNLFFPELSGIIQPLSGEYAGRRAALEQLPFFSGYGVETGLLIDMLDRFGLKAIAQVDLQERIHHNQPLVNLSRMAFAILQVFIARLEARNKVKLLEEFNRSMKLIRYEPGRFFLEVERISDVERPPMITVPAYRRKWMLT
ncbi:MAG: glucosyl-3-phosphoglycerate synthase [Chloroflexota bacterium]